MLPGRILNFLHMGLEGKRAADITGPFTFGEIACQLSTRNLVYLSWAQWNPHRALQSYSLAHPLHSSGLVDPRALRFK